MRCLTVLFLAVLLLPAKTSVAYVGKVNTWAITQAPLGDKTAQYQLGEMYARGQGVQQDNAEAIKWWRKAAEQGEPSAEAKLAEVYSMAEYGITRDYAEATKWALQGAGHGNNEAELTLGQLYLKGNGIAQNYLQAIKWFHDAQELPAAQKELGKAYLEGKVIAQDYTEAYFWFSLCCMEARDEAAKHLTQEQIADVKQWVKEWSPAFDRPYFPDEAEFFSKVPALRETAAHGNVDALAELAIRSGEGIDELKAQAEKGDAAAEYWTGWMYWIGLPSREGLVRSRSPEDALKWWRKAAEQGHLAAQKTLGEAAETGWGAKKDCLEAMNWWHKAAKQGDLLAVNRVKRNPWCPAEYVPPQNPGPVIAPATPKK